MFVFCVFDLVVLMWNNGEIIIERVIINDMNRNMNFLNNFFNRINIIFEVFFIG